MGIEHVEDRLPFLRVRPPTRGSRRSRKGSPLSCSIAALKSERRSERTPRRPGRNLHHAHIGRRRERRDWSRSSRSCVPDLASCRAVLGRMPHVRVQVQDEPRTAIRPKRDHAVAAVVRSDAGCSLGARACRVRLERSELDRDSGSFALRRRCDSLGIVEHCHTQGPVAAKRSGRGKHQRGTRQFERRGSGRASAVQTLRLPSGRDARFHRDRVASRGSE